MKIFKKRGAARPVTWWEFILLGIVPTAFAGLALLCYAFGGPHGGILMDVVAVVGVPAFVSSLALAVYDIMRLFRQGRRRLAAMGIVLYFLSMAAAACGLFLAMFLPL